MSSQKQLKKDIEQQQASTNVSKGEYEAHYEKEMRDARYVMFFEVFITLTGQNY